MEITFVGMYAEYVTSLCFNDRQRRRGTTAFNEVLDGIGAIVHLLCDVVSRDDLRSAFEQSGYAGRIPSPG